MTFTSLVLSRSPNNAQLMRLSTLFSQSPVLQLVSPKSTALDDYVKFIDTMDRQAYASLNRLVQEENERAVFVRAEIPELLHGVVLQGILEPVTKLSALVIEGSLYRHDVSWLGLTTPPNIEARLSNTLATFLAPNGLPMLVDVVRKWQLGSESSKTFKMCPRCRSVAKDLDPAEATGQLMMALMVAGRQCVCANMWSAHEERVKGKKEREEEDEFVGKGGIKNGM
jgi:hypothetical protein